MEEKNNRGIHHRREWIEIWRKAKMPPTHALMPLNGNHGLRPYDFH